MARAPTSREQARLRLYEDFPFYAEYTLQIRTKEGDIRPLRLKEAQRRLVRAIQGQWTGTGRVRVIILKGRQMGLSTVIGAWLYWWTSQRKAQKTLVMAHKAKASQTLFDMTRRYHDLCPDLLRPHTKYNAKKELTFDVLQSSYTVETAEGEGVGRSETLNCAHLSEVAFWPQSTQEEMFNGLKAAVPNKPGTAIFVESTANGVSGVFYNLWQGAAEGKNEFIPVFLPWFIDPDYREPVPEGFKRTPDEEALIERYGDEGFNSDEQLQFRRLQIAATSLAKFQQEYPSCAEEAFLTSGMPVFNPQQVLDFLKAAPLPRDHYALQGTEWVKHPRGELREFIPYDPLATYYIGADTAEGIKGRDYSVAQVLDGKGRQVAVFRSHVQPYYFADLLFALGERYNWARIIPEANNHGILTCTRLAKDLAYPNVFMDESVGEITEDYRERIGFLTGPRTKPLILDELRAKLRNNNITIYDRDTLKEMQRFVVTPAGKMQAEKGTDENGEPYHDDCVMALALASHIWEGDFTPVQVTDDFYIKAL